MAKRRWIPSDRFAKVRQQRAWWASLSQAQRRAALEAAARRLRHPVTPRHCWQLHQLGALWSEPKLD